jgi:PAS domain S-box-containing protein
MLWLSLLAACDVLVISLRRVLRRQRPLTEALHLNQVAVEHVHSGAAWVRIDGKIGSVNQSLADSVAARPTDVIERDWLTLFAPDECGRVQDAYASMLLSGISSLETWVLRDDGMVRPVNVRLVAVHDHKTRLVGHHCMIRDESRERALEDQVQLLSTI